MSISDSYFVKIKLNSNKRETDTMGLINLCATWPAAGLLLLSALGLYYLD